MCTVYTVNQQILSFSTIPLVISRYLPDLHLTTST